jgi:hypothetical protein
MIPISEAAYIRKITLSGWTADTWAVDATLAAPPTDAIRFLSNGQPFEWAVYAMSGSAHSATLVAEVTTTITTCIVKLAQVPAPGTVVLPRPCGAVSGAILNHPLTETEMRQGDVFVIAISAITVDAATHLWVVPHSGFIREPQ